MSAVENFTFIYFAYFRGGGVSKEIGGLSPPASMTVTRPVPIVLVKCWKVAHWNAKKLLKNCRKSKKLLPKFQKLLPKFLAIFI